MRRVFMFESSHLDTSKLRRFGEICYVFNEGEQRRPLRDQMLEEQIISQLSRFQFDPINDRVAIVGNQLSLAILLTAVVTAYGSVQALCFDPRESDYYERSFGHIIVGG